MNAAMALMMQKCDMLETPQLIEMARELNLATSNEEMLVSAAVANTLESRMDSEDFVALMGELEAQLIAA